MLTVKGLEYTYKKSGFAIKNISFSLEDGYLMCLIGKNGAGKTTLLQGIYGLLAPMGGEITYNHVKVVEGTKKRGDSKEKISSKILAEYHKEVAFVGGVTWIFRERTMKENIDTLQALYDNFDQKEYERLLQYFGLTEGEEKKNYEELSTGQKMLFQIAFSMARHPKLLLMDEPFANLDPIVKVDLAQLLQDKIEKENMQVIVSTHLVDDISSAVDYIGVMKKGELVRFGDRESILDENSSEGLREFILKDASEEVTK